MQQMQKMCLKNNIMIVVEFQVNSVVESQKNLERLHCLKGFWGRGDKTYKI